MRNSLSALFILNVNLGVGRVANHSASMERSDWLAGIRGIFLHRDVSERRFTISKFQMKKNSDKIKT